MFKYSPRKGNPQLASTNISTSGCMCLMNETKKRSNSVWDGITNYDPRNSSCKLVTINEEFYIQLE